MQKMCVGPECSRPAKVKNLCNAHDLQQRRKGELKPLRTPRYTCSHSGCDRKHHSSGYCSTHYGQFRYHGKTFDIGVLYHQAKGGHETIEQFFWARVDKTKNCWEWTGSTFQGRGKYGYVTRKGYEQLAHRLSYKMHHGDIPEGMQVDHICLNKTCVKPSHLRLATPSQNNQNRKGARIDSTTGIRGATPNGKRFSAYVVINGNNTYLGMFDTPEEAGEVAKAARLKHYTHNYLDRI